MDLCNSCLFEWPFLFRQGQVWRYVQCGSLTFASAHKSVVPAPRGQVWRYRLGEADGGDEPAAQQMGVLERRLEGQTDLRATTLQCWHSS